MFENLVGEDQIERPGQVQFQCVALHETDVALLMPGAGIVQEFRTQIDGRDVVARLGKQQRQRSLRTAHVENPQRRLPGDLEISPQLVVVAVEDLGGERGVPHLLHVVRMERLHELGPGRIPDGRFHGRASRWPRIAAWIQRSRALIDQGRCASACRK